jgi:hypothetical protein
VVGEGIRQLGRERADLAADAPQVVEQARPVGRELGQELGEPQDIDARMIIGRKSPPRRMSGRACRTASTVSQ